ncbi:MAG: hypothetical protein IKP88_16090 [Lachnospiraceae bacterium]|nr:hypothetical protein [Lachnospiraceae bacterium]
MEINLLIFESMYMGRKRLKPEYNPEKIMKELIDIVKELYFKGDSYRQIAKNLDMSVAKVIKLLITGGVYYSDLCRKINKLYDSGKTVSEIQKSLNISRASVQAYLPYRKCIYNAKELSLNAERIRRYRLRKRMKEFGNMQ